MRVSRAFALFVLVVLLTGCGTTNSSSDVGSYVPSAATAGTPPANSPAGTDSPPPSTPATTGAFLGTPAVCTYLSEHAPPYAAPTAVAGSLEYAREGGLQIVGYAGWLRDQAGALQRLVDEASPDRRPAEVEAAAAVEEMARIAEDYGTQLSAMTDPDAAAALQTEATTAMQDALYTVCLGDLGEQVAVELRDENQILATLSSAEGLGCRSPEMYSNWMGKAPVNVITCHTSSSTFRVVVFDDSDALEAGLKAECVERKASGDAGGGEAARGANWVAYSDGNPEATNAQLAAALGGTVFDPFAPAVCEAELAWDRGTPEVNETFCPLWGMFPEVPTLSGDLKTRHADALAWVDAWSADHETARKALSSQFGDVSDPAVAGDYSRLLDQLETANVAVGGYAGRFYLAIHDHQTVNGAQAVADRWREQQLEPALAPFDKRCPNGR